MSLSESGEWFPIHGDTDVRLRTARKLFSLIDTHREHAYSPGKLANAAARVARTRSARDDERFWRALMKALGPAGRAEVLVGLGDPAAALRVLMGTPEGEWAGGGLCERVAMYEKVKVLA